MYISFGLMALIFLRQISIYKQPNKINYAPLILGIGAIASVIHFIISDEHQSVIFVLKGSFIPFLVALMLYIIMNIMHQTQRAENERTQKEFTLALVEQLAQLKEFTQNLEERMQNYAKEELQLKEEFAAKFREDIETLTQLLHNQQRFMDKFEELREWHKQLQELFINFTEFKLPELDGVIHKHIEMLRIANKEQFEKITASLEATLGTKESLDKELESLQQKVAALKNDTDTIAKEIVTKASSRLEAAIKALQKEFVTILGDSQTLKTKLLESENKLEAIKTQSEFVIRQMVLVSKKMESFEEKKEMISKSVSEAIPVMQQMRKLQESYERILERYEELAKELSSRQQESKELLEAMIVSLPKELEASLHKLEEKLESRHETVSESMKLLAKQAQLQKGGYTEAD